MASEKALGSFRSHRGDVVLGTVAIHYIGLQEGGRAGWATQALMSECRVEKMGPCVCTVSKHVYGNGQELTPLAQNDFCLETSQDTKLSRLEQAFDDVRPAHIPSRKAAYYAFDNLAACDNFWHGEVNRGRPGYINAKPA
jgi:hypothetical protein